MPTLSCLYPLSLHDALPISRVSRWPPLLVMLLRKEVIQPHLPVRLPCYDLVPITDPTFDSSLTRKLSKDRKSTRLNSSHVAISYAVFCLKKKNEHMRMPRSI